MSLLTRHVCLTPLDLPVVEDQRVWTCPECQVEWRWDVIPPHGIGWVKQVELRESVLKRAFKTLTVYQGPISSGWDHEDHDEVTDHNHAPWWWPL